MARLGLSLATAATGMAVLLGLLGDAWAACIEPGNLVVDGIDCLRIDPTTTTTITTYYDDVKIIPGNGYIQLALESFPAGGYTYADIQYKGASYTTFNPSSRNTGLFPDAEYTTIQQVTLTRPSYINFSIPAGVVPLYGGILQVGLAINNNRAASAPTPTAPDGVLLDITGNDYFSATRSFRTLQPTKAPTQTPTVG